MHWAVCGSGLEGDMVAQLDLALQMEGGHALHVLPIRTALLSIRKRVLLVIPMLMAAAVQLLEFVLQGITLVL